MNTPSRFEIEKFANEKFQADLERRIDWYAEKQAQVLAQVRSRGNSGGYLPALSQCKQEKLRAEILALADAWVEAGTIYAVPLPVWAEKALEKAAAEMAAGTVSALRGELDLHALRTRTQHHPVGEGVLRSTLNAALREGKLRVKAQRIQAERSIAAIRDDLRRLLSGQPAASLAESRAEAESFVPKGVAERKKRGRPQVIPDERKAAALEVKRTGGSNKDAAKKLYNVTYPSATRVKSASTILREYQKKLNKPLKKSIKTRVE